MMTRHCRLRHLNRWETCPMYTTSVAAKHVLCTPPHSLGGVSYVHLNRCEECPMYTSSGQHPAVRWRHPVLNVVTLTRELVREWRHVSRPTPVVRLRLLDQHAAVAPPQLTTRGHWRCDEGWQHGGRTAGRGERTEGGHTKRAHVRRRPPAARKRTIFTDRVRKHGGMVTGFCRQTLTKKLIMRYRESHPW